jgi:hypothetical protein
MENELIIKHLAQIQSYLGWILLVLIIGFFLVCVVLESIDKKITLINTKIKNKA